MSMFESVPLAPEDPILSLPSAFARETHPRKVNLGAGIYKNARGKSVLLESVKKAEKKLSLHPLPKDYLPMDGDSQFVALALELMFGNKGRETDVEKIIGLQTLGGTGALSLAGHFFRHVGVDAIYASTPTWPNHIAVFTRCGLKFEPYPYYKPEINGIDFEGMCAAIKSMPARSAILLQVCCHNPTGIDLTKDQWKTVCKLVGEQNVIPFFDIAYHGFGTSLEEDLFPIHYFLDQGLEFFASYSFSKNCGLYGERVGLLAGALKTPDAALRVRSQFKAIIRGLYSTPPMHGSSIVATLLADPKLKKAWIKEVDDMRGRIHAMRTALADGLTARSKVHDFEFLHQQKGLFSFCGLTPEHAKILRSQYGIYMLSNGRINIAGLNPDNVDYVVDSFLTVMESR